MAKGKYGDEQMREMAGKVKNVLIAGDIVDGVGVYPNQQRNSRYGTSINSTNFAAKYLEKIPDYIELVISPGNHDAPAKLSHSQQYQKDI